MTNFRDQMHIDDPAVVERVIFVDTETVKATDFDVDKATRNLLYDNRRRAAEKFLSTGGFDQYREEFRRPAPPPHES